MRLRPTPTEQRLFFDQPNGASFPLSARTIAAVAFNRHPGIRSQFKRFKSEEARYDFLLYIAGFPDPAAEGGDQRLRVS